MAEDDQELRPLAVLFFLIRKLHLFGVMNAFYQIDELVRLQLIEPEGAELLRHHFREIFEEPPR